MICAWSVHGCKQNGRCFVHLCSKYYLTSAPKPPSMDSYDKVLVEGHDQFDAVHIHEDTFGGMRLLAKHGDCWVVVHKVEKGGDQDWTEEREQACREFAENAPPIVQRLYIQRPAPVDRRFSTYIGLHFDKLYYTATCGEEKRPRIARTNWSQYIAVAYLPDVDSLTLEAMWSSLDAILKGWTCLVPECRPSRLLSSSGVFWIQRPGESDEDREQRDFINTEWEEIEKLVESGSLTFCREPAQMERRRLQQGDDSIDLEFVREVCANFHDEDVGRVREAREVDEDCTSKHGYPGTLEIKLDKNGVVDSEVKSVLHYMRQELIYRFEASHREPRADVGVKDQETWRLTPQTIEIDPRREGEPGLPRLPKYVPGHWPADSDTATRWLQPCGPPPRGGVPRTD